MSELREKQDNVISVPMFNLAFRPMFLLASIFSILALVLWGITLADIQLFKPYGGSHFWHAHEMVFGFVSAILVGFFINCCTELDGGESSSWHTTHCLGSSMAFGSSFNAFW